MFDSSPRSAASQLAVGDCWISRECYEVEDIPLSLYHVDDDEDLKRALCCWSNEFFLDFLHEQRQVSAVEIHYSFEQQPLSCS